MAVIDSPGDAPPVPAAAKIAGVSVLKGLILYEAVVTFAALQVVFIVRISGEQPGHQPAPDAALVSTAAALSGVLGSAFALYVGTPSDEASRIVR